MNRKKILLPIGVMILVSLAWPLCAQSGCVDSPEDPTILLGVLAGAGAIAARLWKSRIRRH